MEFPNFRKKDSLEKLIEIFEISFQTFLFHLIKPELEFSEIFVHWNAPQSPAIFRMGDEVE